MAASPADTIFALSSGQPPAAIAVIRISGTGAGRALAQLAGPLPKPRHASLRSLRASSGALLDRVLVLWFPGPNTVTGEDMAELHVHGGRAVVRAVLAELSRHPALRMADAGEFTRRAFGNGRIDLLEAEGLADLLQAETEQQHRHAVALMDGGLTRQVDQWQHRLLQLAARIEGAIDFSDEDDVPAPEVTLLADEIGRFAVDLEQALAAPAAERLRDGIRIVIAGPPNAGKSTLLNRLVGREAAIVSAEAGTTRDVIEVPVDLRGTPVVFMDTAGIRAAVGPIEAAGIDRAERAMQAADLVLWTGAFEAAPEGALSVRTKSDLPDGERPRRGQIAVSAFNGQGLEALINAILERASALLGSSPLLLSVRQRFYIGEAYEALIAATGTRDVILIAEHLRSARALFDRLTGRASVEEMLDQLFGRFCVGK